MEERRKKGKLEHIYREREYFSVFYIIIIMMMINDDEKEKENKKGEE